VHLQCYDLAKVECEQVIGDPALGRNQQLMAWQFYISCCAKMQLFHFCRLGLSEAKKLLSRHDVPDRTKADFAMIRASVHERSGDYLESSNDFSTALKLYEEIPRPFEACKARINMAQSLINLGKTRTPREHLEKALRSSKRSGYARLTAVALSHLVLLDYRGGRLLEARRRALQSNRIARRSHSIEVLFRNCFYLLLIARATGDDESYRANKKTLGRHVNQVGDYLPEAKEYRLLFGGGS
jgi:tetratricopeptide (TPR) repeat protein